MFFFILFVSVSSHSIGDLSTSQNGQILINEFRLSLSNYTDAKSSYSGISMVPDPSCFFVSTSYFETPSCPHSHCGSSFPVPVSTGLFKKAAICISTRQDYHFTFDRFEPIIPSMFRFSVRLTSKLTNAPAVFDSIVRVTLDPDILLYCNSARLCIITTKYCHDLSFFGSRPPLALSFSPGDVGDLFRFSIPSVQCKKAPLIPLDDVYYNLPYEFHVYDSLKFFLDAPATTSRILTPLNFSHALTCSNFSKCPTPIPLQYDVVEHVVHVSHLSLGASIVRSFFHVLSTILGSIFSSVFSFVTDFISDSGIVNILDTVFVFAFLKFFMCTSNSLVTSLTFLFLRLLVD